MEFSQHEIIETIRMTEMEHLDIRNRHDGHQPA